MTTPLPPSPFLSVALPTTDEPAAHYHPPADDVAGSPLPKYVLVDRDLLNSIFRHIQREAHRERLEQLPMFLRAPSREYLETMRQT